MGRDRRGRYFLPIVVGVLLVGLGCQSRSGRPASAGPATPTAPARTTTTRSPPPVPTLPAPGADGARVVISPTGVVLPVLATVAQGWQVRTPCFASATISAGTPVGHTAVVLDPGHGGSERGAVAPSGLAEADVNLAVSRQAEHALEAAGVSVLLTRTGDYDVDLSTRAEIATRVAPLAFVSVHHNAAPDRTRDGPGSETYYQLTSANSKRLAGLVYEEVTRALAVYKVAWVAYRDAGAQSRRGSHGDYYAMLRLTAPVVAVLSEAAFISNPPEAELLARPDVQRVEGEALARGIMRYLTTADPGSGFTDAGPRPDPPPATGVTPPCHDPQLR